ncbi:MAG TPA: phage/plasmid primase, P4 family, partial [Methanoregulaceae archaeon]|nr:phage/plasmid primase, P4 family [Methanoregulaceae archaeon]
ATNASWYLWNGALWEKDLSNRMYLLVTRVPRSIYDESRDAPTPDQAKALARWAITSENLRTRKAMIESATPLAAVELDDFDAREYLLNCRNGTLELDTLTLREHKREDLLTRCCGVAYDPSAECPQWNAHLDLIFDKDAEYISGFQAMCGYSLLQANPEQLLFILFGKGKNGKSKTIEVLAAILGDYAVNIAAESLMVHRCEGIRSDLARIAGARMATASEGEDGARLAESIIKQLTGEYAITVRRLYENEFEFTPTAKIWLTTNHEPVIRGTDDGIWRRIWMVPFTVQIAEEKRDPEIEKKLIAEGPGILNWCLEGLQRYFASGNRLVKPRKVSVATGNYRTVSDTVSYFLATECAFEPGRMIARSAFREMFEKWCEEEGIRHPIAPRRYATILKSYHIRSVKSGGERFWSGIRWKTEEERDACDQRELVQEPFLGFAGS